MNKKIRDFIEKNLIVFDNTKPTFSDDDDIFNHGFVNSLFAIRLVSFIEQEFNIQVDSNDLELSNFNTINNIVRFIAEKHK